MPAVVVCFYFSRLCAFNFSLCLTVLAESDRGFSCSCHSLCLPGTNEAGFRAYVVEEQLTTCSYCGVFFLHEKIEVGLLLLINIITVMASRGLTQDQPCTLGGARLAALLSLPRSAGLLPNTGMNIMWFLFLCDLVPFCV